MKRITILLSMMLLVLTSQAQSTTHCPSAVIYNVDSLSFFMPSTPTNVDEIRITIKGPKFVSLQVYSFYQDSLITTATGGFDSTDVTVKIEYYYNNKKVSRCNKSVSLPVDLVSFDAIYNVKQDQVTFNWITSSEYNNSYFELQSLEGDSWMSVGIVNGAGFSNQLLTYSYTLHNPQNIYYRLVQADYDGKTTISKIVYINLETIAPTVLYQIYYTSTGQRTTVKESAFLVVSVYSDGSIQKEYAITLH